jgi:hypothetical protein
VELKKKIHVLEAKAKIVGTGYWEQGKWMAPAKCWKVSLGCSCPAQWLKLIRLSYVNVNVCTTHSQVNTWCGRSVNGGNHFPKNAHIKHHVWNWDVAHWWKLPSCNDAL